MRSGRRGRESRRPDLTYPEAPGPVMEDPRLRVSIGFATMAVMLRCHCWWRWQEELKLFKSDLRQNDRGRGRGRGRRGVHNSPSPAA
ncbi:hypothetical protein BDW66DRAFT_141693 [Aspergillus desertorum]